MGESVKIVLRRVPVDSKLWVLNVGGSDKKIKLVSFMRDNLVYIDGYSQVINSRKQTDNKLNVAYELGEQEGQKGAEMVRQVLKDNFDLDIKYYAWLISSLCNSD